MPTSNPAYALGAFDTVNLIVGRLSTVLPGPPPTMQRPYAQEVEMLFDACAFNPADYGLAPDAATQPESSAYCTLGTQFYARWLIQYADPHDLADYYIDLRKSLSGWDLAAHVRAARLAGFDVYSVGIVEQLRAQGYTLGHFPQSFEYSTVGGWVVTRSSGQQSLRYGRIEQMFAGGKLEAPIGTMVIPTFPASSAGPDLREMVLGSEARLGVLTEVTVRVTKLAEHESFHAIFLPDWDAAEAAVRGLAQMKLPLSMLRLSNAHETFTNLSMAGHAGFIGWIERYLAWRGCGDGK